MNEFLDNNLEGVIELVSTWGLKVLGAILVLLVGLWVARIVRSGARRVFATTRLDDAVTHLLANFVYYAVIAVVIVSFLGGFGIETASLITVLGASSLAIGLALQGSLSNIASGVMLFVFHPYRVGDFVELGEQMGTVVEIGLFSTSLDTLDNVRVVIPNSQVSEVPVRNWSTNGNLRLDLEIAIDQSGEIAKARETAAAVLRADPRVLKDPEPSVGVKEFGDTATHLVARPWCLPADYWDLRFDLLHHLRDGLEAAGFTLPTPEREVQVVRPAA